MEEARGRGGGGKITHKKGEKQEKNEKTNETEKITKDEEQEMMKGEQAEMREEKMMKQKEEEEEDRAHDPWHDSRRGWLVRPEQLLSWESHQVHDSPADGASTQASLVSTSPFSVPVLVLLVGDSGLAPPHRTDLTA